MWLVGSERPHCRRQKEVAQCERLSGCVRPHAAQWRVSGVRGRPRCPLTELSFHIFNSGTVIGIVPRFQRESQDVRCGASHSAMEVAGRQVACGDPGHGAGDEGHSLCLRLPDSEQH